MLNFRPPCPVTGSSTWRGMRLRHPGAAASSASSGRCTGERCHQLVVTVIHPTSYHVPAAARSPACRTGPRAGWPATP